MKLNVQQRLPLMLAGENVQRRSHNHGRSAAAEHPRRHQRRPERRHNRRHHRVPDRMIHLHARTHAPT